MKEYGIKIELEDENGVFVELKDVINVTINSSIDSLSMSGKIRVASGDGFVSGRAIKLLTKPMLGFDKLTWVVSEVLSVDERTKELIIHQNRHFSPQYAITYSDIYKSIEARVIGDLEDELVTPVLLKSIEDIEIKLKDMGVRAYHNKDGELVLDSKFGVRAQPVLKVGEADLKSFNLNLKENDPVRFVNLNQNIDDIYANANITLAIDPTPQPLSPKEEQIYTNAQTSDVYKIVPVQSIGLVYHSPAGKLDSNLALERLENYTAIEEYELEGEDYCIISGFIKNLNGVSINSEPKQVNEIESLEDADGSYYLKNTNVLCFNEPLTGLLKVSYQTDIDRFVMLATQQVGKKKIQITHLDQVIDYTHEQVLNGFYPLPYTQKLNVIKDYNLEPNLVSKAKLRVGASEFNVDVFGDCEVSFKDYGIWAIELLIDNKVEKTLYISYFANEYEKSFNEIKTDE